MTRTPGPLLAALRKTPKDGLHTPEQTKREMVEHASEFPAGIRDAIALRSSAPEGEDPSEFVSGMYVLLKRIMLWKPPETETAPRQKQASKRPRIDETTTTITTTTRPWGGFDAAVDTEEEMEVAIRLFPRVLFDTNENNLIPIDAATESPKTIPFVPVLAELMKSFEGLQMVATIKRKSRRLGLDDLIWDVVFQLVTNTAFVTSTDCNNDEALTLTLVRFKERSLMTKKTVDRLVYNIVWGELSWSVDRLRFLIEWSPTALRKRNDYFKSISNDYFKSLFYIHLRRNSLTGYETMKQNTSHTIGAFEMLFEAGMIHYPNKMGFFFYTDIDDWEWKQEWKNSIQIACDICGREAIFEMVHRVLSRTVLGNSDAVRTVALAVATNNRILLDALYLLVRADPAAVCGARR